MREHRTDPADLESKIKQVLEKAREIATQDPTKLNFTLNLVELACKYAGLHLIEQRRPITDPLAALINRWKKQITQGEPLDEVPDAIEGIPIPATHTPTMTNLDQELGTAPASY